MVAFLLVTLLLGVAFACTFDIGVRAFDIGITKGDTPLDTGNKSTIAETVGKIPWQ